MTQIATVSVQYLSAFFALAAAILWVKSALIRTPSSFAINVARPTGVFGTPLGGDPLGGTYFGQGYSEDLNELGRQMRRQSRWSAAAAVCAAVGAVLQGGAILMMVFL
jgi:hypothetical protein